MSMLALRLFSTAHAGKEFIRRDELRRCPDRAGRNPELTTLAVYSFEGG